MFAPVKLLFPAANTSPPPALATLSSTYFFVAAIKSAVGLPLSVKSPVIVPPAIGSFVESVIVMFAVPSKDTPLIVLAVASFVADLADVAVVAVLALPSQTTPPLGV